MNKSRKLLTVKRAFAALLTSALLITSADIPVLAYDGSLTDKGEVSDNSTLSETSPGIDETANAPDILPEETAPENAPASEDSSNNSITDSTNTISKSAITGIEIISEPSRQKYPVEFTNWTLDGMQVKITYADNTTEIINAYEDPLIWNEDDVDPFTAGDYTVTVSDDSGTVSASSTISFLEQEDYIKLFDQLAFGENTGFDIDGSRTFAFTAPESASYMFHLHYSTSVSRSYATLSSLYEEALASEFIQDNSDLDLGISLEAGQSYLLTINSDDPCTVNVTWEKPRDITEIQFISQPLILQYPEGYHNGVDYDGAKVKFTFSSGDTEEAEPFKPLKDGRYVDWTGGIDFSTPGTYHITVSCGGKSTTSSDIQVIAKDEFINTLDSLVLGANSSVPIPAAYKRFVFTAEKSGDFSFECNFDTTLDANVQLSSLEGDILTASETGHTGTASLSCHLEAGKSYILSFRNSTGSTAFITCERHNPVKGIQLVSPPDVSQYVVSDSGDVDYSGMTVKVTYSDGTSEILAYGDVLEDGSTLDWSNDVDFTTPGTYHITVSQADVYTSADIKITVGKPSGLTASAGTGSASVKWTAAAGARGYETEYSTNSLFTGKSVVNSSGTSSTISKLASGTSYYVRVRAYALDSAGQKVYGAYTGSVSLKTKPAAPEITKLTGQANKITVNWNRVTGAQGYQVYISSSKTGTYTKAASLLSSASSFTITGLKTAATYYIKVRASNTSGAAVQYSSFGSIKYGTTSAAVPSISKVTGGPGKAVVTWKPVPGATGYAVYMASSASGTYSQIGTVKSPSLSFIKTGLSAGKTYYFKVRSYRTGQGINVYSNYSGYKYCGTTPPAPSAGRITGGTKAVTFTWKDLNGESGYQVYMSSSLNGTYSRVASLKANTTSYTKKGLSAGRTYYFKVRSYRTVNGQTLYSGFSSKACAATRTSTPVITSVSGGTRRAVVKWKAVSGASGYVVYMASSAKGTYKNAGSVNSKTLSFTKTGLASGKNYYFKVRAYRTAGGSNVYSSYSAGKYSGTAAAAPSFSKVTAGTRKVSLRWKDVSGESSYQIYVSGSKNGKYSRLCTLKANTTSYTKGGLTKGKLYYFKIRSCRVVNGKTIYSSFSAPSYARAK